MELLGHQDRPAGFFYPANPGNFGFLNSDLALNGDHAFTGSFNGFNIYNVSDPADPSLEGDRVTVEHQAELGRLDRRRRVARGDPDDYGTGPRQGRGSVGDHIGLGPRLAATAVLEAEGPPLVHAGLRGLPEQAGAARLITHRRLADHGTSCARTQRR